MGLNKPFFQKIGKYFYNDPKAKRNGEFDVVTWDSNGYISYECKFTNEKVGDSVVQSEKDQIQKAKFPCYKLGFISKSGFQENISKEGLILYTLDDLYDQKLEGKY